MNLTRLIRTTVLACLFALIVLNPHGPRAQDLTADPQTPAADGSEEDGGLPRQFREIVLGMGLEELKAVLIKDNLFNFRGDRDVSFIPVREESLVETTGSSFIKRAFFQLRDGTLFIMAFTLNTEMMDHYSVFTGLVAKYGEPSYLDPKEAVWETEETRIAIERPLTVKYIDKVVFDDIINESTLIQSRRVQQYQDFLDEF